MTAPVEKPENVARVVPNAPWPVVKLGDVAKTSSGGTPKRTAPSYYGGGIPWVKSGELGDSTVYETSETISEAGLKNSSAKIFPKGTLCVALYGATVGKLGILGMDAATNQAVCGIFLPPHIDTRFVYRFLEHKRRDLIDMAKGGAQPNISQDIIRNLEIPLPPLPDQRRIVAEIEQQFTRLDAGVAALRRTQANLKRYRAAVLKAACEGRLVPTEAELAKTGNQIAKLETGEALLTRILTERKKQWSGKGTQEEPTAPDISILPPLPNNWVWANIGQLRVFSLYGPRFSSDDYAEDGYVILRTSDISESGKVDTTKAPRLRLSQDEFERYRAKRGDLLVTRTGSLGTLAIFDDDVEAIPGAYLIQFRLATEPITTRYLFYLNGDLKVSAHFADSDLVAEGMVFGNNVSHAKEFKADAKGFELLLRALSVDGPDFPAHRVLQLSVVIFFNFLREISNRGSESHPAPSDRIVAVTKEFFGNEAGDVMERSFANPALVSEFEKMVGNETIAELLRRRS